ncbi:MAG: hypothetical protein IJF56_10855 [Clostridia bacterium]|nr:hypothetical protein [Clostridia bacterium]
MMNDIFVEYMVKKKMGAKDIAISIGVSMLGALLIFVSILLAGVTPMIPFIVICGVIYGVYWVISSRSVEFEYSVTNGDISIDKIINRKSRKRLTSFDAKAIEEMGKYTENEKKLRSRRVDKTIFASDTDEGKDAWYVIAKSRKTGLTLLVFSPNDRCIEAIKPFMDRRLRFEIFGRR